MDLYSELKKNKQLFDESTIDKVKYEEKRKIILEKWTKNITPNKNESSSSEIEGLDHSCEEIDLYAALQLTCSATEAEIKSNYKKFSLKYHPDKNNGVETEEWYRISRAYQILSDKDRREFYDNYGKVNDIFGSRTSFNYHIGGDIWKPYIGDLEIGIRLFSYVGDKSLPELEYLTSLEQKERRHAIRVSNIVNHLQDKLSRFPKEENSSEFESYRQYLRQETLGLLEEPNGKKLLTLLGGIYVSEAEAYFSKGKIILYNNGHSFNIWSWFKWALNFVKFTSMFRASVNFTSLIRASLASGFLGMKKGEVTDVAWLVSKSEISSIAHEVCKKTLNSSDDKNFANSLKILGEIWLEAAKEYTQLKNIHE